MKVVLDVSLKFKKKFIFCVSAKLTSYSKAMEIAAGFDGVQSVELKRDNSNLEVTGDDIDLILLVKKLNEEIGNTIIVTVAELKKEETNVKSEKKVEKEPEKVVCYPIGKPEVVCYPIEYCECHDSNYGGCSIL